MVFPSDNSLGDDPEGVVLRIEKLSIHDGEGLRTVVFLKGCPLSCLWCSTPESQRAALERGYNHEACRLCGACVENCPEGALAIEDGAVVWNQKLCRGCFVCERKCLAGAVRGFGKRMRASEVVAEISRDEVFYFHSGGGVTISGGECLLQPEFVVAILHECKQRGIETAVETSLYAPWKTIERFLPLVDTFYVDIKHPDATEHKKRVGADNGLILENLRKLDSAPLAFKLHLRLPLIPGVNDSDEVLDRALRIAESLERVDDLELLPYHRLGAGTYERLGRSYALADLASPSPEYIRERLEFLRSRQSRIEIRTGGGFRS